MGTGLQWATLVTLVLGFIGVVVAIWSHRKAVYAQIVTHYSTRFEEAIDKMPITIWMCEESDEIPPRTPELTACMVKYFNLTFEEWYMRKRGYFPADLWRIWKTDIQMFLADPVVLREWEALADRFAHHRAFDKFIRRCIEEGQLKRLEASRSVRER